MTSQVNGTKNGCIMKNFNKIFFAAVAAAFGLASCSQELTPVEKPQGNLVTVNFGAEASIEPATKATLTTEDELTFKSAWANGDIMSVKYSNGNKANGTVPATWNASSQAFEATLPEYTGMWDYNTVYPAPDADGKVDFGSVRTQKGNAYNSNYDLMKGAAIAENAAAGKDDNGKNIIFEMTRQTAVAYFHLTGTLDEEVVSAKLSVEGDGAYISTSDVKANEDYAKGYVFTETEGVASKEINLTFDAGTAPKASDFKLWFNVLPTIYTKMTLAVETANHTMTISRTAEDMYEAGKLYKVVKEIPAEKWVSKAAYTGGDLVFDFKTHPKGWPAEKNENAGNYDYELSGVKYAFNLSTNVYCKGTTKVNGYLMISGKNENALLGLPAISGFKLTKVVATINDQASISSKTMVAITDGVDVIVGGAAQNWKTKGAEHTYTLTETEENTVYYMLATVANAQVMKLVLSYEPATPKTALETPANLQVSAEKVVSWDAVSGAASYEVTIGKDVFTSETNSYDATAVVDDYYDVAVVAVPSDKENYKNSTAVTLSGAKFGTPKLATPELTEGAIDETSIRVNMAVDSRATNGCTCEIYNGETLIESKTIKVSYVVFSKLESGVTYTIKINAIAVEGEKPYAASDVASIELKTKATQHVSDVTAAGTYTIKGLTVYAVANASVVVAGDNTGYILVYKKSHGLNVGNTFDAAGNAELYKGVWELNSPSITNIKNGEIPVYPNAVEATEDYLIAYSSSQKIQYVHIKGTQTGKYIEVGGTKVFMETPTTEMEGKNVDAYGFVYGYHTTYNNAFFVVTSIKEDQTIPTLSVDQTSKVWAADATDAFVVKVTVNSEGGDWTVTPTTLDWATVAVDKAAGTITVTPNGANTTETANEAKLTVAHASDASLTKEITLKQNAAGGDAAPITVAKKISDMSGSTTAGTQVSSMIMDDVITLSASDSGNNGKVYENGTEWRLYQSDKGTMTVSSKAGYVIESIIVTFTNKKSGTLLYNSNAVTSGKAVSVSGSSVKFTLGNSSTATNGQIIVTEISVTYKRQ